MTKPADDKRVDFAARAFGHKGRAEAHRLKAEMTSDQMLKGIHTAAAATYEDMAIELDKTARRVADIDRATARVRTTILALSKSQLSPEATTEPASKSHEP